MSIFKILRNNALHTPNKIALIFDGKQISYKKFYELVLQTVLNLKENNFKNKSVVVVIEDNSLSHILSLFALSYINCTVVPTGTYYSNNHLTEIIELTKSDGLIGHSKYCDYFKKKSKIKNFLSTNLTNKFSYFFETNKKKFRLKNKINIDKNFIITLSSGSTAKPKPIVFSQHTKIIRYKLFKKLYNITSKDTFIVTSPIDHSLGMRTLYVPLLCGATCVVMNKFNVPLYCDLIKKYKVTFSVLVASQIYEIVKKTSYFKNFYLSKGLISASTKLFSSVKNKILSKKINLYEMYGAAEVGTVTSINLLKDKKNFKSVGRSYQKNINIKILSDQNKLLPNYKPGEIICKTPGKFKFYLNSKKLNSDANYKGYFKTGDVGFLDKKNYLYFLSRKKNIIRRSGITIYPEDIENILLNDKKIHEVAVIGKETKNYSHIFLFIKKNNKINESYIKNICLKKLSTFQLPNKIIFLKKFPKTNLGKINKKNLLSFAK
jgi:long-chain acyl-CoA synthetase